MKVVPVELLDGSKGRDFVLYGPDGLERFSARLLDGMATLDVGWTDNVPRTVIWLREAQQLSGGPTSFRRITGIASDQLERAIRAGTFNTVRAAEVLSRSLGGEWRVTVEPRLAQLGVLEIVAEFIGDRQ